MLRIWDWPRPLVHSGRVENCCHTTIWWLMFFLSLYQTKYKGSSFLILSFWNLLILCLESERSKSASNNELGRWTDGRVAQHECKHNDGDRNYTKDKCNGASGDSGDYDNCVGSGREDRSPDGTARNGLRFEWWNIYYYILCHRMMKYLLLHFMPSLPLTLASLRPHVICHRRISIRYDRIGAQR